MSTLYQAPVPTKGIKVTGNDLPSRLYRAVQVCEIEYIQEYGIHPNKGYEWGFQEPGYSRTYAFQEQNSATSYAYHCHFPQEGYLIEINTRGGVGKEETVDTHESRLPETKGIEDPSAQWFTDPLSPVDGIRFYTEDFIPVKDIRILSKWAVREIIQVPAGSGAGYVIY